MKLQQRINWRIRLIPIKENVYSVQLESRCSVVEKTVLIWESISEKFTKLKGIFYYAYFNHSHNNISNLMILLNINFYWNLFDLFEAASLKWKNIIIVLYYIFSSASP